MTPLTIAEFAARAAHEVNQVYCCANSEPLAPPWHQLTEAQRNGVIAGAEHAIAGGSPEDSHNLWMASRVAEGWVYGEVKSFEAKTSPCLVPYRELPETQRRKDALFQGVVLEMAEALRDSGYGAPQRAAVEVVGLQVNTKILDGGPVGCGHCQHTQRPGATHCYGCGCPLGLVPDSRTQVELNAAYKASREIDR